MKSSLMKQDTRLGSVGGEGAGREFYRLKADTRSIVL
jgi:hypothetical protein